MAACSISHLLGFASHHISFCFVLVTSPGVSSLLQGLLLRLPIAGKKVSLSGRGSGVALTLAKKICTW